MDKRFQKIHKIDVGTSTGVIDFYAVYRFCNLH